MTPLHTRSSGILLHPTSLPGPHGVGDLGPAAFRFVEFLHQTHQHWWQILPLGPTGATPAPYGGLSAFAGNPLLISLERLAEDGLILAVPPRVPAAAQADFGAAQALKGPALKEATEHFATRASPELHHALELFRSQNSYWLPDFALYAAVKRARNDESWSDWPRDLRLRERASVEAARDSLAEEIARIEKEQFLFARQWEALRRFARQHGVAFMGDIPIFVSTDSADVWARPENFRLDEERRPRVVTGVPPDYFSADGQLWGNPHYDWEYLRADGYRWWIERFRHAFAEFDSVRIDHFIGFHRAWEVAASAKHAREGQFRLGPGADFFEVLRQQLGKTAIIAEDLGILTPEVRELRDRFGFPGMRVVQFGFGDENEENEHQPHTFVRHAVAYTGTHDNDTTVGWYRQMLKEAEDPDLRAADHALRRCSFALRYAGSDGHEVHWDMIRLVLSSVADLAIIPLQDILGLGSEHRMNTPGTVEGNWLWRYPEHALTPALAARLATLTLTYGRAKKAHKH